MNGVAAAFSRAAAAAHAPPKAPPAAATAVVDAAARDDRFGWPIAALTWVLFVLMIVPDGFDYAALAAGGAPEYGSMLSRMLWLGLLGGGLLALLWRPAPAWLALRWTNPFLIAFVVLAVASVAWSINPQVSVRRLIRVLTVVVISLAFVLVAWHARRFQSVLRPIITAVLLGSVAFGLAWPTLAIHQDTAEVLAGAWHGLASHKNGLGNIACIGLILWFHAWLTREARTLPALLGLGLAGACLLLSRSSTSLVATAFSLLFLTALLRSPPALRRYMPWLVALFVGALLTYSLVALRILPGLHTLLGPIGAITGKDLTFTGRTEIWDIMLEHIREHPILGAGYGAYWTGTMPGTPSFEFVMRLRFNPASAHNGYLEVLNELGALGLFVLFGYLATFVAQGLRLLALDRTQGALLLALLLQQAVTNLAESRWLNALSVDFVLMTLATTALARALLEQRLRAVATPPRPAAPAEPAVASVSRPSLSHGARP